MTKEEFLQMSDEQKWSQVENLLEKKENYWRWYKEANEKAESLEKKCENLTVAVKALSQNL